MYTVIKDNVRELKDYKFCENHELSSGYFKTFCEELGMVFTEGYNVFRDNKNPDDTLIKHYYVKKDSIEFHIHMTVDLNSEKYEIELIFPHGTFKYNSYKGSFEGLLKEYRKEWYIKNG